MNLNCLLTCPHCGHESLESMPLDYSQEFRECDECHQAITTAAGDCCVYRSHGNVPCACAGTGFAAARDGLESMA